MGFDWFEFSFFSPQPLKSVLICNSSDLGVIEYEFFLSMEFFPEKSRKESRDSVRLFFVAECGNLWQNVAIWSFLFLGLVLIL